MLMATGSDAMWQGKVSISTARAVVEPFRPAGPMPRALIRFRSWVSRSA